MVLANLAQARFGPRWSGPQKPDRPRVASCVSQLLASRRLYGSSALSRVDAERGGRCLVSWVSSGWLLCGSSGRPAEPIRIWKAETHPVCGISPSFLRVVLRRGAVLVMVTHNYCMQRTAGRLAEATS